MFSLFCWDQVFWIEGIDFLNQLFKIKKQNQDSLVHLLTHHVFASLMTNLIARRLEQYTEKRPQEVLIVQIEIEGEPDEIAIFKGFSSSLIQCQKFALRF